MALSIGQTFKLGSGIRTGVAPGGSQFGVGAGQSVKIIGSRNVGGQQFFDIQHIGGGTGWTPASSLQQAASARPRAAAKKGPTARQRAASAFAKEQTAIQKRARREEEAFLGRFRGFVGGQEPLPELRQRLLREAGVPELQEQLEPLRQQSLRLGQTLLGIPEEITGRTRGTLVTEAQRSALESARSADIERQLRDVAISQEFFAGQLTGAQKEAGEQLGAFQAQFTRELLPFEKEATLVSARIAREVTGYTLAAQARLDALLGDITRAEELSDIKREQAFELAKMERQAVLQERQIRLSGSISAAATARTREKEAKEAKTLRGISKSLLGAFRTGPAFLLVARRKFLAQFPEFRKEITELSDEISRGLK